MRHSWLPTAILSVLAVILCARAASAQRSVPGIEIQIENWAFIPTLYNGEVETFVALRTDAPEGNNITSMWFIRGANNSWSSWGWEEQDQSKTIGYVKTALQLPAESDHFWKVAPAQVNPNDLPPGAMERGVFVNDPFADVVASAADPDAVLNLLVTLGWAAVRNSVIAQCEIPIWLDALRVAIAYELQEEGTGNDAMQAQLQAGGCGTTCKPVTIIGGVSSSGCVDLTGWLFTPPSTTGVTLGQCYPYNCWHGSFFCFERRNVR